MQHLEEGTIHAWIDGALSTGEVREVEAHMASCEACSRLAAEARGLVAASSRILTALDDVPGDVIPIAPPAAMREDASIAGPTAVRKIEVPRWRTPFWMRTAAAVVVIAGTSALVMTGKLNNVEPAKSPAMEDMALEPRTLPGAGMDTFAAPPRSPARPERGSIAGSDARSTAGNRRDVDVAQGSRASGSLARPPVAAGPKPGLPGSRTEDNSRQEQERFMADRAEASRATDQRQSANAAVASSAQARDKAAEMSAPAPGPVTASPASPGMAAGRVGAQSSTGQSTAASALTRAAKRAHSAVTRQPAPAADAFGTGSAVPARQETIGSATGASAMPGASRVPGDHPAVGCYALSVAPWSGGTIPFGAPPARIELDSMTSTLAAIRGYGLVHPARGAAPNGAPLAYWRALGDSVHVTWRDDRRGVMLRLPIGGEVLRGSARTVAISGGAEPTQSSTVEARRISCRE